MTAVTRNVAPIDKIESEGAPILSLSSFLLGRLIEAADGNVAAEAIDVAPIQAALEGAESQSPGSAGSGHACASIGHESG